MHACDDADLSVAGLQAGGYFGAPTPAVQSGAGFWAVNCQSPDAACLQASSLPAARSTPATAELTNEARPPIPAAFAVRQPPLSLSGS